MELVQLGADRRPPAEIAHRQVREILEGAIADVSKLELEAEDVQDVRYALVAFADEMLQLEPGRFQEFWNSHLLQEEYFGRSLAGEKFYERLADVRADARRRDVLLVYYLCMVFGYRGKYRGSGGMAFENLLDDVCADLRTATGSVSARDLAPLGERPDEPEVNGRRNLLLQAFAVSVAVMAVILYAGLWLVIDDEATDIRELITDQRKLLSN